MAMDEKQKKELMTVAAIGGGGLLLFVLMKGRGTTINPPVQAQSGPGSGISSGSYVTPFSQQPPPSPLPLPIPLPPIPCAPGLCRDPDSGMCIECGPGIVHHCPFGQYWDAVLGQCVTGIPPLPGPPHIDCQVGYHWDGTHCVADGGGGHNCPAGQSWCEAFSACIPDAENCPGNSPIQAMKLPMFAGAKGGGVNPVPQTGKRTDSHPAAFSDGNDTAYNWNLLSAYYSMRFH